MGKDSSKNIINKVSRIIAAIIISLAWLTAMIPNKASAAIITDRVLTLGNSQGGASTTYTFIFRNATTATFQSFKAQICTSAEGACSTPTDFVSTSSNLTSTNLSGSWDESNIAGSLRGTSTGASSTTAGTLRNIAFETVTNPSDNTNNFFARITLYSDDAWTTAVDTGTVSASVAKQNTVTVDISEVLTFTLDTTTVNLGPLTADVTGTGTSTLSASTNATNGYSVTVSGNTLESGVNSITALAAQTASTTGTAQFGINLVNNATPNVGADPSGGSGAGTNDYNDADLFRFVSGDSIASTAGPSNSTTFTVSYIANVATTTAIGDYSTTLTYIVTGNF